MNSFQGLASTSEPKHRSKTKPSTQGSRAKPTYTITVEPPTGKTPLAIAQDKFQEMLKEKLKEKGHGDEVDKLPDSCPVPQKLFDKEKDYLMDKELNPELNELWETAKKLEDAVNKKKLLNNAAKAGDVEKIGRLLSTPSPLVNRHETN